MAVADRFQKLIGRIEPLGTELMRAQTHAASIEARLNQAFGVVKFTIGGSHERGTAIRDASDVDYFAVLKRAEARHGGSYVTGDTFLQNVRDELNERFPQTAVTRDRMAVVVHFDGGNGRVDVVPAVFERWGDKHPVYRMPDGYGGWMETAPSAYTAYLAEANQRSTGKLRRVTQLIKYWKICRAQPIPLRSFHVEMLLAHHGTCVGPKSYQECIRDAFALLTQRGGAALQDPLGLSGNIHAAYSQAQREAVTNAAAFAWEKANRAIQWEVLRDTPEAVRYWDMVFNGNFPA